METRGEERKYPRPGAYGGSSIIENEEAIKRIKTDRFNVLKKKKDAGQLIEDRDQREYIALRKELGIAE